MWFRKNTGNVLGNTVWIAPRVVGTWLHTIEDVTKTALYWVLDAGEWLWKTANDIKTAIHNACTKWPWYKKLVKAPASIVASPLMAIEWGVETLFGTWWNTVKRSWQTIKNPFINLYHWVWWIGSKKNVWEFKFSKLNDKDTVNPKNRLASLF